MITIIDYKAGNIRSIQNMLKKIGYNSLVSDKIEDIERAEKLILPGVGAFDFGMGQLQRSGLIDILNKKVLLDKTPILGICLGVQLMTHGSEEGSLNGLGWLDAQTVSFDTMRLPSNCKVPHMGWNEIVYSDSRLLTDFHEQPPRFYFVHSFHLDCKLNEHIMATTNYGYTFPVGLEKQNILGVQFHPEKSHQFGMQVLKNFITKY